MAFCELFTNTRCFCPNRNLGNFGLWSLQSPIFPKFFIPYNNTSLPILTFNYQSPRVDVSFGQYPTNLPEIQIPNFSKMSLYGIQNNQYLGANNNNWFNNMSYGVYDSFNFNKTKTFTYNNNKDKYKSNNEQKLQGLTAEMREKTKTLIAYAIENGYDVKIVSGYRTEEQQKVLQERYKNEPGRASKNSPHTRGKAIDIELYKDGKKVEVTSAIGNYAKNTLGMRWGGNFKSYREPWHFDYNWA